MQPNPTTSKPVAPQPVSGVNGRKCPFIAHSRINLPICREVLPLGGALYISYRMEFEGMDTQGSPMSE
jgi:hypothetical protein